MVAHELQQPNTPPQVREWARALPPWVTIQKPQTVDLASMLARLRQTKARLDPELVWAALARDQARREKQQLTREGVGTSRVERKARNERPENQ